MRKRRWRKWLGLAVLALAVLGPPLAFGVSNLFLMSPKGRDFVAGRIERTIQLETSVQGSTWSPWNGFVVHGLLVKQPGPLREAISSPMLTAESIRIHPDWRALAKRKLVMRGVEILKPDLAVPIELLSQIPAAPVEPPPVAQPPDLAVVDPVRPDLPPTAATPATPPPEVASLEKQEAPKAAEPSVTTAPTVWISVSNGKFRIVSAMIEKPVYRISRINGAIPVGGKTAHSGLSLGGIGFLGNEIPGTVKIPIQWEAPHLQAGSIKGGAFGIDGLLEAKIALTPGVPFLIAGLIPKQEGKKVTLSEALWAKLGSVAGQARIQGFLLAPGTWQGQGVIQTLEVETGYTGRNADFRQGQALVIFQSGVLRCVDARLLGEETSILGNAMLLSDGRFASVARIVASPESLIAISKQTQPHGSAPQLTPLATPQRAALDMQVFGFPGNFFYQPHPAAEPIPLQ